MLIEYDIRKNINTNVNDVIVIKKPWNYTKDGKVLYDQSKYANGTYIVSFSADCHTKYEAETITALVLYGFAIHMVNFMNQRIRTGLLHVINKYNLSTSSNEVNQLAGVFQYVYSLNVPYLYPVKDFQSFPVLDLLFFLSPEIYKHYAKFAIKHNGKPIKLIEDKREDKLEPVNNYSTFFYFTSAEDENENILDTMIRRDKRMAAHLTTIANDGMIDEELEQIHELSNMIIKLKDILNDDQVSTNHRVLTTMSESSTLLNESFFKSESEFRYKLNKIIIASKYLDSEDERTSILVDIYNLNSKLSKFIDKEESKMNTGKTKKEDIDQIAKVNYLRTMQDELKGLETSIVNSDIKPKKFGIFIEYPAGYDY